MPLNFVLIGIYILAVLGIGWWTSRQETTEDFTIASRRVGLFRSSASMFAVLGGVVLAGQATLAFLLGMGAMWFWIGIALGAVILGFAASRIKPVADQYKFITLAEYFKLRWGRNNQLLAGAILFVAFFSVLVAQFIVVGNLLNPFLNLPYAGVVVLTGAVVLFYLLLGGYKAVIITDAIQASLMVALLILVAFVIPYGSFSEGQFDLFALGAFSILSFVILGIAAMLASADLWQRVFSAQNIKTARRASYITGLLFIVFGFTVTLLGITAANAFPEGNPDEALFLGIFELVPSEMLGLSIVLVLATVMSTLDTLSFLLSSIITKDFLRKERVEKRGFKNVMRIAIAIVIVLAVLIAIFVSNILTILFGVMSLLITLSPAVFGSLFWRLKSKAVLLSLSGGAVTLIVLFGIGQFSPETAVTTFPVALVLLIIGQITFKENSPVPNRTI